MCQLCEGVKSRLQACTSGARRDNAHISSGVKELSAKGSERLGVCGSGEGRSLVGGLGVWAAFVKGGS